MVLYGDDYTLVVLMRDDLQVLPPAGRHKRPDFFPAARHTLRNTDESQALDCLGIGV